MTIICKMICMLSLIKMRFVMILV